MFIVCFSFSCFSISLKFLDYGMQLTILRDTDLLFCVSWFIEEKTLFRFWGLKYDIKENSCESKDDVMIKRAMCKTFYCK